MASVSEKEKKARLRERLGRTLHILAEQIASKVDRSWTLLAKT